MPYHCPHCTEPWFWKKIGRCQSCINRLSLLSIACWALWWWFRAEPTSIGSITLIVAGLGFHGLLLLHLWMKWIVLPWRQHQQKKEPPNKTKKP